MYGDGQCQGIYYKNKNTQELMRILPEERPVSLQLFGSDPEIMSEMAKQIEESRLIFWMSTWDARCRKWLIMVRDPH